MDVLLYMQQMQLSHQIMQHIQSEYWIMYVTEYTVFHPFIFLLDILNLTGYKFEHTLKL